MNAIPVFTPQGPAYKTGDRIANRYEIYNIFGGEGKSGMGIVYVCFDHEFKEILALKTFQERYLYSKKIKDSFKKEALAWIHLEKHPYIVKAHWVQELDNRIFVACEYISGDGAGKNTLTQYVKTQCSLKQILAWSIQFCYGMEYAYSKGVTPHRDIKPDNILITIDSTVKITDFGFAGLWDKAEMADEIKHLMHKSQTGFTFLTIAKNRVIVGTPPWMAPEQFYGVADAWSDIYSFGIVMYQMANKGELPFQPKNGDSWETAHRTYPVPSLQGQGEAMSNIIEKCLNKRREKRYKDFKELREDLETLFKKEITKKTGEKSPLPPEIKELSEWEHINKGISLANLGFVDEAIKKYREGLKINPKNVYAYNNLGNAYAQKGLYDGAIKEYREAIKINPDYTEAYYNLGIAFSKKGLLDDAIKEYNTAIKTNPMFSEAYITLADAFSKKGLKDQAIRVYGEILRLKPEFVEAHINLGNIIAKKGMLDEAIKEYREAVKINPRYAEAHNNLGLALFKKDLLEEAVKEYREAIRLKPEYAEAYHNLGAALFKKDLPDEAIKEYREAIRIKPGYAEAYHNLGTALFKKGLLDDAIKEYKEAVRIKSGYAEAYYNLGLSFVKKGLSAEAVKAYEDFIKYASQKDSRLEKVKEVIKKFKEKL